MLNDLKLVIEPISVAVRMRLLHQRAILFRWYARRSADQLERPAGRDHRNRLASAANLRLTHWEQRPSEVVLGLLVRVRATNALPDQFPHPASLIKN